MKTCKRILGVVLMAAMLLSLLAVGAFAAEDPAVLNVGSINAMFIAPLELSNVDGITTTCSYAIGSLVYDQLFYPTVEGTMASDVVESYEYSEDYMSLTIKLKDNIYFASGDQLTGEDVLFSLACKQTGARPAYYVCIDVDQSTVSDDGLTVTLVYKYPFGPGIRYLDIYLVNKSFYEELAPDGDYSKVDWYSIDSVDGSGPYKLVDYVQDTSAQLEKREDYWAGALEGRADVINLIQYTDQTTMYIDFENGVLDVAVDISSLDAQRLQDGGVADGALGIINSNACVTLCLNENNQYLADPAVREAIAYALDINVISDAVLGIFGTPAQSTLAQTMAEFSPGHSYPYDPDHARQVLADAGYSAGEIVLDMVGSSAADQTTLGEMVQAMLGDVGITVNVGTYDFATMLPMLLQGQTDLQRMTTSDGTPQREPLETYSSFVANGTFPAASIPDEAINEALDRGYSTVDPEGRKEAYIEAQQLIFDTFRAIPLYEWNSGYAYNTAKISQIDLTSVQRIDLRFIYLNE